jgi:hypothetical protein
MALVLKDRVKETTTTVGTGSFALAGAVTGYDSFGQIGTGNTTYYAVYLDGGSEWEVGIGTYTAPSTLSRDTILASSNSGSIVTFSAGQKTIWCDYPAGKAVYTDANGSISQTIVNISGITGDISTPDSITFDTTAAETSAVAKLFWDDGDGVLSNGLKGGNVTLQIGTQEFARVYNDSGTTLTKGQAVYISGAQGNRVAVKLARADVEATSFGTIGLVAETMTSGAEGFIIVSGALYKLNTLGLTAGATVYLSPTTAGAVTTTKPQAPDQLVVIGWVERVDNIVGSIYVKIDNGYELDELHDVRITSPQSGNVLIYDATTTPIGVWKNANLTDGTGISITEGAGSVTITNTGVTSVTGTSPVVSSGGTTPAISMPAATSSVNGYLTSTDWTTFNSKGNGTVTSVSGTGTVSGISLSGTVTSSGSLSLGGVLDLSSPPAIGNTTPNTVAATTITASTSIMPAADNTGVIGDATTTWSNGQFTNLTIDSTLNVRAAIDLADSDVLRMGSSDDWSIYYNGTTNKAQVEMEAACLGIQYTDNGTEISYLEKSTGTFTAKQLSASNGLVVNSNTVSASYSIPSGSSATSAGPMTIASGVTVTVPSGSRWVVL